MINSNLAFARFLFFQLQIEVDNRSTLIEDGCSQNMLINYEGDGVGKIRMRRATMDEDVAGMDVVGGILMVSGFGRMSHCTGKRLSHHL